MNNISITKANSIKGQITVPGDKSISHRGVMFGAIAEGLTELTGFLDGADCRSTISCFRNMGIDIRQDNDHVLIQGKGLYGLKEYNGTLDVGNSGTTTRLISGILAGSPIHSILNGDASIQSRPMKRIIEPLRQMGADISSIKGNDCAPLQINGGNIHAIHYNSPVASAQVKSCILLAGLYCDGETSVTEPVLSRNHTELMLNGFGADVRTITSQNTDSSNMSIGSKVTDTSATATIIGGPKLIGQQIAVPGDISSAAYFIVAGLICDNSDLLIENVNCNPTRAGILKVCEKMGANIEYLNKRIVSGEEVCDIHVTTSDLHGCRVDGELIPTLIDEIPVIAVMASQASGTTVIADAAELKVKESNRIDSVVENLRAMGIACEPTDDGMIIHGRDFTNTVGSKSYRIHGAHISTKSDHRIAMSFAIAGLVADGETSFDDENCVAISYPTFFQTLQNIINR